MKDESTQAKDGGSTEAGPEASANLSQTSSAEEITSRIEGGKQYDGTSVLKMMEDALSADGREQKDRAEKAEADVKRLTGDLAAVNTNVNTLTTQVSEFTRAKNEAEADAVKDNPEALGSLRARQANQAENIRLQRENATLESGKTQLQTDREALNADKTSISIKLAAMAAGVDEKALGALVPDGDPGRLALAANTIKKGGAQVEIDPTTGKPKPAGLTQPPVTTVSAGGDSRSVSEKMLEDAKKK